MKFTKKDIGKKVQRITTHIVHKERYDENWVKQEIDEEVEMIVEDTIVSVPNETKYEKKYNSKGVGLHHAQNKVGVMLEEHPWEYQENWEIIK